MDRARSGKMATKSHFSQQRSAVMTIYIQRGSSIPYLSPRDVAKITGISVRTPTRIRKAWTCPKFRKYGVRIIQCEAIDVNQWFPKIRSQLTVKASNNEQ